MAKIELPPQAALHRKCKSGAVGRSKAKSEQSEEDSSNGSWAEATLRKRRAEAPPALGQFSPLGETASACERLAQRLALPAAVFASLHYYTHNISSKLPLRTHAAGGQVHALLARTHFLK